MRVGTKRRIVVRGGRRFSVCGLSATYVRCAGPLRYGLGWVTSGTLVIAIIFCAFAIGRPPAIPVASGLSASLAHYSIDDLVTASH